MKEEKRRLIGEKLDSGMTRAQVTSIIMFTHYFNLKYSRSWRM